MRHAFAGISILLGVLAAWLAFGAGGGERPGESGRAAAERPRPRALGPDEPRVADPWPRVAEPARPLSLGPSAIPRAAALARVPAAAHAAAAMIWAVAARELDALPPLYAPRIRAAIAQGRDGFAGHANDLDAMLALRIGRYDPSSLDFRFDRAADGVHGEVRVEHEARLLGTLRVVLVGSSWLLDER
ncbi:MAG: hypothetical protein IT457_15620 [Planctomycetes bacterium]|nr:hypothetical protein [Planctomycetota bacterium]